MRQGITKALGICLLATGSLYADFTYEETSKITGGAIVGMMKFAGAFSKDARRATEPINSTVAIQGNRMVRKSQLTATITDLDAETITAINFEKKTYSVMTFAQMKQAMEDAMKQMNRSKQGDAPDMQFDVKIKDTGATKTINGLPAHEMLITMTMQGTDQKSGAKGGMDIVTDSWITPKVAGYEEVRQFQMRMATKLGWVPGGAGMLNRPDIAKAMSEVYKEGAKMDGVPVLQVVRMGGAMEGMPPQESNPDAENRRQTTSSSNSSSSSAPPTSIGGALGSALGGRFGLGRKKKEQQQEQPADASSSQASPAQGSGNGNSGSAAGSLLEMTIELTSYSSAPANSGLFAVPSGFKQVEADAPTGGRRSR